MIIKESDRVIVIFEKIYMYYYFLGRGNHSFLLLNFLFTDTPKGLFTISPFGVSQGC